MFAPGADGCGAIDDTTDHLMRDQVGFDLLRHILRIRNDYEGWIAFGVIDDLDVSRCVHRVF
ncbi:hypothetical protein D3C85_1913210 [compost metagenome]